MQTRDQPSHCKHACAKIPKIPTRKHATHETTANMQTCKHAKIPRITKIPKIPKIAKTQHANWQTKLPPPTHAKACVITRDGPQVHAVQPRMPARTISHALADSHTHARASEMHAERIPTRSDSIRMQSRNAHNHASNNLLVRNAPMISPMNLTTERIPTRSDSIRMQSRNAHDAHGISSYTRPRASPLHAEANPTPNQNGRCNEAPLPTQ